MTDSLSVLRFKQLSAESPLLIIFLILITGAFAGGIAGTGFLTGPFEYSPMIQLQEDPDADVPVKDHSMQHGSVVETTVTNDTFAYESGETLVNAGAYPLRNSTTFAIKVTSQATNANLLSHRAQIKYEATLQGNDAPFWTETVILDNDSYSNTTTNGRFSAALDIEKVANRTGGLEEEFGSGVDVVPYFIVVSEFEHINYDTAKGGEEPQTVTKELETKAEMSFSDRIGVLPDIADSQSITTGDFVRQSDRIDNSFMNWLLTIIAGASIPGIVLTGVTWWRTDPKRVQYQIDQIRNEEWVTSINEFNQTNYNETSAVDSLTELVDLALDTHNRVLYSRTSHEFIVVTDSVKYVYSPTIEPSEDDIFKPLNPTAFTNQQTTEDEQDEDTKDIEDGAKIKNNGADTREQELNPALSPQKHSDNKTQSDETE